MIQIDDCLRRVSSLKFYLYLMTILKSLKSCINLNLTSSGERLNLHSLCNSHCNLDSLIHTIILILRQLVLFVKYFFFFPLLSLNLCLFPSLDSALLYADGSRRECCYCMCEWMNKVDGWNLNCQIIIVNVILMSCSHYLGDIISCRHKKLYPV